MKDIEEILTRFPDEQCLVYYVIDSITEKDFSLGDYAIEFCKEAEEQQFWHDNICYYPHLFTAAILKYESEKDRSGKVRKWFDTFSNIFHQVITEEGTTFSDQYSWTKKKSLNIVNYLYSKPEFNLKNKESGLIEIHKDPVNGKNSVEKGDYAVGYLYATYKNGKRIEVLNYVFEQNEKVTLRSDRGIYTSKLSFGQSCNYFDVDNVLSVAKTKEGFVYIIIKDDKYYLRGQGINHLSRLVRAGKQPVYVKAFGNKIIVLMNDGTLISNFGFEEQNVLKAMFNEKGEVITEKERL